MSAVIDEGLAEVHAEQAEALANGANACLYPPRDGLDAALTQWRTATADLLDAVSVNNSAVGAVKVEADALGTTDRIYAGRPFTMIDRKALRIEDSTIASEIARTLAPVFDSLGVNGAGDAMRVLTRTLPQLQANPWEPPTEGTTTTKEAA
jgi:hypothetical protein